MFKNVQARRTHERPLHSHNSETLRLAPSMLSACEQGRSLGCRWEDLRPLVVVPGTFIGARERCLQNIITGGCNSCNSCLQPPDNPEREEGGGREGWREGGRARERKQRVDTNKLHIRDLQASTSLICQESSLSVSCSPFPHVIWPRFSGVCSVAHQNEATTKGTMGGKKLGVLR